jgi:hypothetical protein
LLIGVISFIDTIAANAPLSMSDDAARLDFLHYLMCDLPLGYPLKTSITKLLDSSLMSTRRELLHQQDGFLEFSKQYLPGQPWIAYLAAVKHEAVLVTIPTYAPQLVDIVDQHFFSDLQEKYKDLRATARAAIDEPTALTCERLVLLQSEAPQIEDALKSVNGALEAGFTAVEPLPPPPPEPVPAQRVLPYFITAAVVCVIVGAVIPPEYGGMAWALLGLIITGIVAARVMGKEKARVKNEGARFGSYLKHESYYALCRKSIALVLALPFEIRKSALVNLPPCKPALEALPLERAAMEAAYITPFFPK